MPKYYLDQLEKCEPTMHKFVKALRKLDAKEKNEINEETLVKQEAAINYNFNRKQSL